MKEQHFTFIDLFSGIGGFNQAMTSLGGTCLLASEIDPNAIEVYRDNYKIDSNIDVRKLSNDMIPAHDVLCGGFPCQTFSKAGKQEGFKNQTKGTLFFEIERILEEKHPKYVLLENVRNLASHDHGRTYAIICGVLNEIGYRLPDHPLVLSPHQFGIPQVRERIYIPGVYDPKNVNKPLHFEFHNLKSKSENSIDSILEKGEVDPKYRISEHTEKVLNAWDEFYHGLDTKILGFPIWSDFFRNKPNDPSFPLWKQDFIEKNKKLYQRNKKFIDKWFLKWDNLKDFTPTERKFEWQCGTSIDSLWDGIIQIRPSGVRVKRPDTFPTLVALVQTPIIGKLKRKLTVKEAQRLQSFPDTFRPDAKTNQAYKQFGNSVNVKVIKEVFERLIEN